MKITVRIRKDGSLYLPKHIRKELGVSENENILELEVISGRRLLMTPRNVITGEELDRLEDEFNASRILNMNDEELEELVKRAAVVLSKSMKKEQLDCILSEVKLLKRRERILIFDVNNQEEGGSSRASWSTSMATKHTPRPARRGVSPGVV